MQIEYKKTYQEYKAELDTELNHAAEGFVRIGYLLKVARDTDILAESGYLSVAEFAKAEYGIDKSQVSRFIHINDKFAEGGYSDRLEARYQGFGYAKLTLMLQLPDAVNEALTPAYSKAEIQTIKEEVDAEAQVTDLERMMEPVPMPTPAEARGSILNKAVYRLGADAPELFIEVAEVQEIKKLQEVMAPAGEKTYSIRLPRIGRIMLMLSDTSDVRIVNVRTGDKEETSWEELYDAWAQLTDGDGSPEHWEKIYHREYPKKEPVAPVQPKIPAERTKKVVKAKPENVENIPSEPPKEEKKAEITPETAHEESKNVENTQCEAVPVEDQEEPEPAAAEAVPLTEESVPAAGKYDKTIKLLMENTAYQANEISKALNEGKKELKEYRKIKARVNNLNCDLEQLIKFMDLATEEGEDDDE